MLIAGSLAGLSQALLGCPIEVVKIRLQTLGYIGRSYNCMQHIYNHEGIYGLYRGLVPMIWRDILPYGIYSVVYDWMYEMGDKIAVVRAIRTQSYVGDNTLALKLDTFLTSFAALTASVVSWSLITPLDVVKTLMQAETNPNIHKNMLEVVNMLRRAHKFRVLFSGVYMNIGKSYATLLGYQYCLNKCQASVKENEKRLNK
jgi:Mitochondrial carrier protein